MNEESPFQTLKTPDKILLGFVALLALGEEALYEIRDPFDLIRGYKGWDPEYLRNIRRYTFRQAFLRLLSKKYLAQTAEDAKTRYEITAEGIDYLYRKLPLIKVRQKGFDGFWRIVVYDVAESERKLRQQLRAGLKKLGFRYFQQSVWLSPYAWEAGFDEFFEKLKLGRRLFLFKSTLSEKETKTLLEDYWPWEKHLLDLHKPSTAVQGL